MDTGELPVILDLKGLKVFHVEMTTILELCRKENFIEAFDRFKSQVMPVLQQNKTSICIVASAPDNLPIVLLAQYYMHKCACSKEKALNLMKQRRP